MNICYFGICNISNHIIQKCGLIFVLVFFICNSGRAQILINELYIKPDGTIAPPFLASGGRDGLIYPQTKEYIELYNAGCIPVNIAGYYIAMKQELSGTFFGGTIRIPNVPAATIPPGEHVVVGALGYNTGASVVGAFDILVSSANACEYPPSGSLTPFLTLPNSEGWVALFDPNGEPLELVYWSSSASSISDATNLNYNPTGTICVPSGATPSTPLRNAYEINLSKPCVVSYINNGSPFWAGRINDADPIWTFQSVWSAANFLDNYSIKTGYPNAGGITGNCNGGSCRASLPPGPSKPTIGTITAVTSCPNNGSVQLSGLPTTYTGGSGNNCTSDRNWTITASPSGLTYTGNTSSFVANGLGVGTTTFTVADFGGCGSATSDPVTITGVVCCPVITSSTTTLGACRGGSLPTLSANTTQPDNVRFIYSNTPLTGAAIYTSGTALGGTITPVAGTITYNGGTLGTAGSLPNVAGTYYVYCRLASPPADLTCRPFLEFVVTVSAVPSTANAGLNQTGAATCGGTSVTLAGNNPAIGTGVWSIVSGAGGNLGNASIPNTTFTGTAGTAYILRWTISNGACAASSDDVNITFNQNPTVADAGPNQTGASTCGLTTLNMAANTPSIGTGTWSIVSGGTGTFSNVNSPTSNFTGTPGATYVLRWTISNSPCTASTDDVTITFNQNPNNANAGLDQTGAATCGQTTVNLNGNAPAAGGTGLWTVLSGGGGTFSNASSRTSTFTGVPGTAYTLRWTISTPSCAATTDDVDIIFNQNPTPANAGPDQTGASTCGQTSVTLAANSPTIGTGVWSLVSGTGGSFSDVNSTSSSFIGTPGVTYTLRWTVTNICGNSTDDVIITFNQNPTQANAGADRTDATTCGLNQVTLAANAPTIGTGQWSVVSGTGGFFNNISIPTPIFNGVAGNTYTFRWTISNSPCTASFDDVVITFNQNPTNAAAGPDQTGISTCGSTTVTLAANAPAIGNGQWSVVSGTGGFFNNITIPTPTFNGVAGNTYTFRWTISNSPCPASSDDVVITFNQNPTPANAGPDQTDASTCGLTQVTLAANTPTIGAGQWSIISGSGGSITNASSPTSTFSGTPGSTYTLRWTVSNSPCNASTDDVVITFNQNPSAASAGLDQTDATTCGQTQVTLNATAPAVGTGTWSVVSGAGGSFGNVNSPTSTFSGTPGVAYTLRWTTANTSTTCASSFDDMAVTFNQNPTASNAGADQTDINTCGKTQVTLGGNAPSVGTGQWSVVSGTGGFFNNITIPTPIFNGVAGNTYTFRWTISNSPCPASTDDVIVTFNQNPTTANAGADQIDAATCGQTQVNLLANTPTVGTGAWSIVSGTGGSIGNVNNAATTFDGIAGNSYTLRWTTTNGAICNPSTNDVIITFNQNPSAPQAGADQTDNLTCGQTQVTLAANSPTIGTGLWSIVSGTGGSITNATSATSTFNGLSGSTYTLRWTVSNSPCTSQSDDVVVTFNQSPTTATAGADQTGSSTCGQTSVTLTANTPTVGTGAWSIVSGAGGSFSNATSPTSTFSGTAGTTYTLRWSISNSCGNSSDDVDITFNQNPTTAAAGADQTGIATCGGTQVILAANAPTVGAGTWSIVNGTGGSFGNTTSPTSTFDGVAGNTYTLRWTVSNNPCNALSDDVVVTFNQNPSTPLAGADQTGASTCGGTQVTLAANNPTAGTGAWSIVSGTGGSIINPASPTSTFNGLPGSTYTLRWTVSNNPCNALSDDVFITFNQNPSTPLAGADQTGASTCGGTQVTLTANNPTIGTGAWSIVSGTGGSFGDATSPTSTFNGVSGSTYTLRWTVSNNPCTALTDDVVVTFNQNPSNPLAGTDQTDNLTCGLTQVTLTANSPAIGTGLWSIVSGTGGSITNATSATSTFNGLSGSTYTLRWTVSNSPCTSQSDDVVVTFNQSPTTATAGADQTGSATCGQTSVTLAANTPTVGTGAWSIVSGAGGSFSNATSPTSTFSGTAGTAYTLRWTISNSCGNSSDDVDITFNQNPTTAAAGADQTGIATCGGTQVIFAANNPTVGTGAWSIVNGTGGSFGNTTSPTSTFDGVAGNTYTLRWTVSNSPCTASTDDVVITFNQNPTIALAGADQIDIATCGQTQVTLSANTAAVGTGTWSIVSGAGGSFANINDPATTFNGTPGVAYNLRWTISNNPCTASSDDVLVTLNQNPTIANAGADQTNASTCGLTLVNLAANTPTVGTGVWNIVSGTGGNITNINSPTSTFTGVAGSTYVLRWTISNSPCNSSSDDVTITFNENPTTSNAGADQIDINTCGLTQVNLAANNPTTGTGIWSIVTGTGGSFTNSNNASTTFNGTAGTSYTLRWTVSNNPCTASTDDIVITFNQIPTTANAGTDQTGIATCGLTQVNLSANTPAVGTGAWSIVSGTGGSFSNVNNPTSSFNGTAGSTYTLRWTISNNPCNATTDDVVITFNQNPTTANAGADQIDAATCGRTQVNLTANTAAVGAGQWSIVSGTGGSFGNSNDPQTTFDGVAGNTYTLRWSVTNGVICPVSTDDVDITFNQAPTPANAGVDQADATTCGLTQVTLAANTPSIGTGNWSIVSGTGGSITNTTDPSSTFNGTPGNTYTLRWTTTNGTFCPNSNDEVIISFNQIPTIATSGADQTNAATCGLTQVLLGANTPTVGSGQWSIVSGTGGNISNVNNPNSLFSGISGNTYTLRWTIDNSPCTASSDDVLVTFNQNPGTPTMTVTQQPDCFIATGTLAVNTPSGNNFEFSRDGNNFQSASTFSGLTPGNYTITVMDISNGCISSAISPAITAQPLPSAAPIIGATETYCQGANAVPLRALGNNLRWYSSATGGTPSTNAPIPTTESAGTFNYYVTQQLTGFCESPRVAIPVSIKALPIADAGPDKEIVQGQRVEIEGNASGNNIDILWTPGTFLSNAKIENPFASPEESTTYRITVTSADGCVATDAMRITVKLPKALEIPNAFSPNGDGFNDLWIIKHIDEYPNAVVQIFNRYGKLMFEITGYSNGKAWDGKVSGTDLPVGPYYYIIKPNSKLKPISGVISIIR